MQLQGTTATAVGVLQQQMAIQETKFEALKTLERKAHHVVETGSKLQEHLSKDLEDKWNFFTRNTQVAKEELDRQMQNHNVVVQVQFQIFRVASCACASVCQPLPLPLRTRHFARTRKNSKTACTKNLKFLKKKIDSDAHACTDCEPLFESLKGGNTCKGLR